MSVLRPETALREILRETPAILSAVSDRITRGAALQAHRYPLAIFARTRTYPHHTMDGRSNLREVDVMVAWYDTDFDALAELVELAEDALSGFEGEVTVEGKSVELDTVYLDDERDGDVLKADGSGEPLYCIEQIYRVAYNRAN